MWILTNFGAFMPALRPARTIAKGDPQTIQIRARRREDLDKLREWYMGTDKTNGLGETYEIRHSDYEFRANCTPIALAGAMTRIIADIDYVSFKDTTRTYYDDKELHDAYMGVWWELNTKLGRPAGSTAMPHSYQRGRWARGSYSTAQVAHDTAKATPEPTVTEQVAKTTGTAQWSDYRTDMTDDELEGLAARLDAEGESWESYGQRTDDFAAANALILAEQAADFRAADAKADAIADEQAEVDDDRGPQWDFGPGWSGTGRVDHTLCDHVNTATARKRCARIFRNHQRAKVQK